MSSHTTDAQAETKGDPAQAETTRDSSSHKLLSIPFVAPRLRVRPWWFRVEEFKDPFVLYLEAWLVEILFGPNQSFIPEIEWTNQVLLSVDMVDSGNTAEVTIYGRPFVKVRMKNIILKLVNQHKEKRRAARLKELEEFLKTRASSNHWVKDILDD